MSELTRLGQNPESVENRAETIKPLLHYVINNRNSPLFTPRHIHNGLFYTEALYYDTYGERLSDVHWNPYNIGMYADEVRILLEELQDNPDAEVKLTYFRGSCKKTYRSAPKSNIDPTIAERVEPFIDDTQQYSLKDVVDWVRDTNIYDATPYREPANFTILDQ